MRATDRFGERMAVLAHDWFPDEGKMMKGVMRYGDYEFTGIVDHNHAGESSGDYLPTLPDVPIVERVADVSEPTDSLLIAERPSDGTLTELQREDIRAALANGWDVLSGLHRRLSDDPAFSTVAEENDATIHELRHPPAETVIANGTAHEVDAQVLLTAGTDCRQGKMTTTMELVEAARERGIDAGAVATGQTGIAVTGRGVCIDRTPADFTAGFVEQLVHEAAEEFDLLVIEGQASIIHPAYAADTIALLHGAMPDGIVFCHHATREGFRGWEAFDIPPIDAYFEAHRAVTDPLFETPPVVAGSLNTSGIEDDQDARAALEEFEGEIDAPATDVIRFSAERIVDVLE
ncbi:DUF1611 domain-containing protein [Halobacteria archaeon AArc-m2/3/4]|uniref:DUF1611 domain-containing protein n=1 Tax=Natronoglomus mannanivorans TaxID=2979990 RepID=A0ABT2QG10_9EURY|nr:DUF1611 domain-containing protein [Halobacteria archaeon AArc-m2/3/4]